MDKAKVIIAICILIAGLFGYAMGNHSARISPATNLTQLNLPYAQVEISGIDNVEQKQIEDFVSKFYEYQQQKDVGKLLALFIPPSNEQEQNDIDFLLGKDLARVSATTQTRILTSQEYNYNVNGYYIRAITRHNGTTTVLVDEMRTIYSGGEFVGYSTNIAKLTIEITSLDREPKIIAYKHSKVVGKYEGFRGY
jgi:hypothetical protein